MSRPDLPQHEFRRQRFALLGAIAVGAMLFTMQAAEAGVDGAGNTTVALTPQTCADPPCTSPDGGVDFACLVNRGAVLRISAGATANLNYRTSLDPDGGVFASTADHPVWATEIDQGRTVSMKAPQTTITLPDAGTQTGVLIPIHLSAADPSAGVAHCP